MMRWAVILLGRKGILPPHGPLSLREHVLRPCLGLREKALILFFERTPLVESTHTLCGPLPFQIQHVIALKAGVRSTLVSHYLSLFNPFHKGGTGDTQNLRSDGARKLLGTREMVTSPRCATEAKT